MRTVIRAGETASAGELGGKAAALARLGDAGFPVPDWLVVTPEALDAGADGPPAGAHLAPDLVRELAPALREIAGDEGTLAVRSSAIDEDGATHSFAGQFDSWLSVAREDVPRRIVDVWRSAWSERVRAYRRRHPELGPPRAPAVLVQRMVDADASGVAFSADPVTGRRDTAIVASVHGLGTVLVSGAEDADTHVVDRYGCVVERRIGAKRARRPALRDADAVAVAALARRAERVFGRPQDIEWAIADGELFLLQSRPITALPIAADRGGALAVWDNSNIAESYSGVTTPLTFTFVRNAYRGVYGELSRIFGIPAKRLEAERDALNHLLGLIQGRIYYNLVSWYRLLALLPGYRTNRAFLDQMIGVRAAASDERPGEGESSSRYDRVVDALLLARSVVAIAASFFRLPGLVRRFHRRVDAALARPEAELGTLGPDELADEYCRLERRLLGRWDAPQVNDFFAMVFYGWLRRLCTSWCGDEDGSLANGLLAGSGGMVSTEPAERVRRMAAIVAEDPELVDAFGTGDAARVAGPLARHPELRAQYESYLQKFGDRCTDELKLESRTLREDPRLLLRSIGLLARRPGGEPAVAPAQVRREAELRVRATLSPERRLVFARVRDAARRFVRGRENLRLERTRVFGRVRAIFGQLGRRFHELGALRDPRDVFYLELDEILGFVRGSAVTTDLAKLAALRREEFARYAETEAPADRFETRGIVYRGNAFRPETADVETRGDERRGVGCCPGRVSGRVRVVRDPATATLRPGDILVAERTDPSWVMLFPFAKGLLVERGSLLSHSAIVAREMGIPAVVSIDGVTRWLRDGDRVELDGTSGVVTRRPDRPARTEAP